MEVYGQFASVYDLFMNEVDYDAWAKQAEKLWQRAGFRPKRLLEMGCGTGNITLPLAQKGYEMTGVDLSEEMLTQAEEKARKAGLSVDFYCQDMCEMDVPVEADGVLCLCDGLNYLTEPEEVQEAFFAAAEHLKDGGFFLFDLNTAQKFRQMLGNKTYTQLEDAAAYIWENDFDEETQINTYDVTFFVKKENGLYERVEEIHQEKAYDLFVIEIMLQNAGFRLLSVTDDQTDEPGSDESFRWTILAAKEEWEDEGDE